MQQHTYFLGYERELNYRRGDMSFSAFGNSRPGSTWFVEIWIDLSSDFNKVREVYLPTK